MLRSILHDTKASILFLSRIPLPIEQKESTQLDFEKICYSFPLAGLMISIPAAFVLWGSSALPLSPSTSALLAIVTLLFTTGALHEDGLADVADGFWGGTSKKQKLDIMRDSSVGTYGALALILSIGLKVSLLAALISELGSITASLLFIAVASLSRFSILQLWNALPPARQKTRVQAENSSAAKKNRQGLSVEYGSPDISSMKLGMIYCLPAAMIILLTQGLVSFMASIIVAFLVIAAFTRLTEQHIQGHTGDTLGATQQLSELGLLFSLVVFM